MQLLFYLFVFIAIMLAILLPLIIVYVVIDLKNKWQIRQRQKVKISDQGLYINPVPHLYMSEDERARLKELRTERERSKPPGDKYGK